LHLPAQNPEDPEPQMFRFSAQTINRAALKELKKLCKQVHYEGKLMPEMEMDQSGRVVTEKSQVKWEDIRIPTKEWHQWKLRQQKKAEAIDHPKPVVVESKTLSAREKMLLKQGKTAQAPETPAQPPMQEPLKEETKPGTVREFVPIPDPKSLSEVENIILDVISDGDRKIPPPKAAKEMDKVKFSDRFGITPTVLAREAKLEDGDLWRLIHDYQREAYLLLKEAMAELEKMAPAHQADPIRKTA
jgi:hypothetical protein